MVAVRVAKEWVECHLIELLLGVLNVRKEELLIQHRIVEELIGRID